VKKYPGGGGSGSPRQSTARSSVFSAADTYSMSGSPLSRSGSKLRGISTATLPAGTSTATLGEGGDAGRKASPSGGEHLNQLLEAVEGLKVDVMGQVRSFDSRIRAVENSAASIVQAFQEASRGREEQARRDAEVMKHIQAFASRLGIVEESQGIVAKVLPDDDEEWRDGEGWAYESSGPRAPSHEDPRRGPAKLSTARI